MKTSFAAVAVAALCLSATSGTAAAEPPPGFPDIAGLPGVNLGPYTVYTGVKFSAPDGLVCQSQGRYPYYSVTCFRGTHYATLPLSTYEREKDSPATTGVAESAPTAGTQLPPSHKIGIVTPIGAIVTCAVIESGATACIVDDDQGTHGFVMSRDGDWLF